ncbi:hypothetical protein D9613_002048 [Agrocybe pediades]|uniref:RNA-binding domain-containing protein n=1 Tax=Agrocybe pediades TaxID=84607 RepID=A0A8H4VUM5_9AGAR|nr:hypothetical protein D9613_002048 [Agrocybe pediades]KAF9569836.1 hypothetical protein CPC08DRAFT_812808 [Agrocybe pediades]
MAAPTAVDDSSMPTDNWAPQDDQHMGPGANGQSVTGQALPVDDRSAGQDPDAADYPRGSSVSENEAFREKQVKATFGPELLPLYSFGAYSMLCFENLLLIPVSLFWCLLSAVQPNKVYIGGLPEHTRQEDLQSCFGKIGNIVNIELKVGYGFVEFDSREAAEESVAKYHEGFFMGNKIRVELSHGGGRTAKFAGDPGACFKCGQMGHWARECPNGGGPSPAHRRSNYDPPLIDRIQRDYPGGPGGPPRALPIRDDFPQRPPRDGRYDYPPPPAIRDHRRPPSPGDYRDYGPPAPGARVRDYDDYRRGPPPPVDDRDRFPPPPDFRGRYPPPDNVYRGYAAPPPPVYDRYDRRPNDRYAPYVPPPGPGPRARTPPRGRDEYDRPPRDYPDYRARPVSPPRYAPDYPRPNANPPAPRYRRRSASPMRTGPPYDPYPMNGYIPGPVPAAAPPPPRNARDYGPRNGRDMIEPVGAYRRP